MAPLSSSHPFKALYTVYFLILFGISQGLLRLRFHLQLLPRVPEWNLKTHLINARLKAYLLFVTSTRSRGAVLKYSIDGDDRIILARPPEARLFSGILTPGNIRPAPVAAMWFPTPPRPAEDVKSQKVVLHVPGGAFVFAFDAHEHGQPMLDVMASHMKSTKLLWAQYRLASSGSNTAFPASIQDLVTFYHYVLTLGIPPQNIILSGDSAGGNLVIALMRYLESQTILPLPAGAMVWSPWVHVTANAGQEHDHNVKSRFDLLPGSFLEWGVGDYLPKGKVGSEAASYISPLHHPFKTGIPLFVQAGASETLFDSVHSFAQEMAGIDGNRVKFHATQSAAHDIALLYRAWGFEREFGISVADAGNFFEQTI